MSAGLPLDLSEAYYRFALTRLDPIAYAQDKSRHPLSRWQEGVLASESRRIALCCSRQAGKSTVAAWKACYTAETYDDSLVLIISPSQRQSMEMLRKCYDHVRMSPVRLVEANKTAIELGNGSRIVSLPSNQETIRGFSSPALVIEDEAAFVADDVYAAITPMLAASNGQLMLLSSPQGQIGHFWDEWSGGGDVWERFKIPAPEVAHISAEFLETERASKGSHIFRQEYMCEFLKANQAVLSTETIDSMAVDGEEWKL